MSSDTALGIETKAFKVALEKSVDISNGEECSSPTAENLRRETAEKFGPWMAMAECISGVSVTTDTFTIDGALVKYRIYRPQRLSIAKRVPAVIYHPAGGFVIDMQNMQDHACMQLANAAGAVVISIQTPLAPEYKHTAIVEMAYQAVLHIYNHAESYGVDSKRFYSCGYSMGGNLAVLIGLRAACEQSMQIAGHLIISGQMDFSLEIRRNPKYNSGADLDFMAPISMQEMFIEFCMPPGFDLKSPLCSPVYAAQEALRQLSPIVLLGGSCDALMPDMRAMAAVCKAAGCDTELVQLNGLIHNAGLLHHLMPDGVHPFTVAGEKLRCMLLQHKKNV